MKFYQPVNFEYKEIQKDFQLYFENIILKKNIIDYKAHDFIAVDISVLNKYTGLQQFLLGNNLTVFNCLLFWCKPYSKGRIHKDLINFCLNIPISGAGSHIWVEVDSSYKPVLSSYGNTSKKKFEVFPVETQFKVLEKYVLTQPTIINNGVRHYVDNSNSDKFRIVVSVRFYQSDSTISLLQ